MSNSQLDAIIKAMPDYLRIKVNRIARDKKLSLTEAVLFLVRKGINASAK